MDDIASMITQFLESEEGMAQLSAVSQALGLGDVLPDSSKVTGQAVSGGNERKPMPQIDMNTLMMMQRAMSVMGQEDKNTELLRALNDLTDKEKQADILLGVKLLLRDALAVLSGGDALTDSETARLLAARLTRAKLIGMIELTDSSDYKLKQNININLLTTWLCGEYRRILWQR